MEIKIGYIYRSKKPQPIDIERSYYDDRQVLWLGWDLVYYDSPGFRKVEICTLEEFKEWAGSIVTFNLPKHEWQEFELFKYSKAQWIFRIKHIWILSDKGKTIFRKSLFRVFNTEEEFEKYFYRVFSWFTHKHGVVNINLIFDEK